MPQVRNGVQVLDLQSLATSALAATFAAVGLNRAIEWQRVSMAARAQLRGILLEIAHAERCAEQYLSCAAPRVVAPVYRVATRFLESSVERLATSATLQNMEAQVLHGLYIGADEINRALDALAAVAGAPIPPLGQTNPLSAMRRSDLEELITKRFQELLPLLPKARAAAEAALARIAWFEPQS